MASYSHGFETQFQGPRPSPFTLSHCGDPGWGQKGKIPTESSCSAPTHSCPRADDYSQGLEELPTDPRGKGTFFKVVGPVDESISCVWILILA